MNFESYRLNIKLKFKGDSTKFKPKLFNSAYKN